MSVKATAVPGFSWYLLPNQTGIYHLNKFETDYLYQEIFAEESYLQNGIELNDNDCVLDIGANIGMFSLFACSKRRNLKILAFEPLPPIYAVLKMNTARYKGNISVFNYGLLDVEGKAVFKYFPSFSILSGLSSADENREKEVLRQIIEDKLPAALGGSALALKFRDYFIRTKLQEIEYECGITTLSRVIRDHKISRIDLLKVDIEGNERRFFRGIMEQDWAKIKQLVMEFHDPPEKDFRLVLELLNAYGFEVKAEKQGVFRKTNTYNIYAKKGGGKHLV